MARGSRPWVLIAAALLLPGALLAAPAPLPEGEPAAGSLRGQFLIASPKIGDPRFAHSVILMVRHDRSGAFGIMVNKPFEERTIASLLKEIGQPDDTVEGKVQVFVGGPVEIDAGFVVHSADYHHADTMAVDGRVAVTSNPAILADIGHHKGPAKSLVALGYAGWGPGQLENEMARRDWFTAPVDLHLLFDDDRAQLWDHAMARRTRDL